MLQINAEFTKTVNCGSIT